MNNVKKVKKYFCRRTNNENCFFYVDYYPAQNKDNIKDLWSTKIKYKINNQYLFILNEVTNISKNQGNLRYYN